MLVCVGRQSSNFSVKQPRDMTLRKLALAPSRCNIDLKTNIRQTLRHVPGQLLGALGVPTFFGGAGDFQTSPGEATVFVVVRDTSGLPGP